MNQKPSTLVSEIEIKLSGYVPEAKGKLVTEQTFELHLWSPTG